MGLRLDQSLESHYPTDWDQVRPYLTELYEGRVCRMCGGDDYTVQMAYSDFPGVPAIPFYLVPEGRVDLISPVITVACVTCGLMDIFDAHHVYNLIGRT